MLKNPSYVYGPRDYEVPGHLNFSVYILEKLWKFKENVALINGATHEKLTYGEIVQQSINFAVSLSRLGVRKGDVIGLFSENRQEYWGAMIGATSTGAAVTTISPSYVKDELKHIMSISKPQYVICSPFAYKTHGETLKSLPFLKKIIIFGTEISSSSNNMLSYNDLAIAVRNNVIYEDFEPVEVEGQSDTLFIVYSSGTTGLPKGVMLSHLNVISCCCFSIAGGPDPAAVVLMISPWYHVMGLVGSICRLTTGITSVYLAKFDMETYLKTIEHYQVPQLSVVPPVLVSVCKAAGDYDLGSVKVIHCGAAPLHKETLVTVYEKFPNLQAVLQGYGASECTLAIAKLTLSMIEVARRKPGSVGVLVPGITVKVVDLETSEAVGPNQRGEICVKGPILMKGYVGIGRGADFDSEGFYRTGDVGYYDDDRFFYISDRLKELIKYKGYQVPPAELEAVLLTNESVKDAGVIGIPHKTAGEVPMAFVVVQPGKNVTEDQLKEFIAERLSNPKHLRGGVSFVEQIPKSASGKILRKDLREMAKAGRSKL